MQHSLKACSHPGEGGIRGQGVRLDCSNEHTRAHPSVVAKEMSASHPHQPLFPPPCTTPISPRRPISGQCGSPQVGLLDASLPVAKSQGTSPHRPAPSVIKAGVPEALQPLRLPGKLRSCLTCWFNAFCLQMDDGVEELCIGTMNRSRTLPLSSPGAIGWRAKQKANLATSP